MFMCSFKREIHFSLKWIDSLIHSLIYLNIYFTKLFQKCIWFKYRSNYNVHSCSVNRGIMNDFATHISDNGNFITTHNF